MKLGILFSGGKDSTYAAYIVKKQGYKISCLITVVSKNPESYMFHTPSINCVEKQAEIMDIPLVIKKTSGKKELELKDLEKAIKIAIKKYGINGIVTGAVESVYQASRIQKICNKLKIECFNPLWQKNQIELLEELLANNFEIILTGVFAYPLNQTFLGRKIDKRFIEEIKILYEKYKISPAGEGGEYESLVLDSPMFKRKLKVEKSKISGRGYSYVMEVKLE
ncbi:MAG: diphthine--ammonia ligase [Nanoarchaeota archaeon]|nr:diphthine--ammonia ligase [Nanoarchaeota archaeon]